MRRGICSSRSVTHLEVPWGSRLECWPAPGTDRSMDLFCTEQGSSCTTWYTHYEEWTQACRDNPYIDSECNCRICCWRFCYLCHPLVELHVEHVQKCCRKLEQKSTDRRDTLQMLRTNQVRKCRVGNCTEWYCRVWSNLWERGVQKNTRTNTQEMHKREGIDERVARLEELCYLFIYISSREQNERHDINYLVCNKWRDTIGMALNEKRKNVQTKRHERNNYKKEKWDLEKIERKEPQ